MIVVLHSETGDSLGLALKLQAEGHEVGLYIRDERAALVGHGLVYDVQDFVRASEKADLILFDAVGQGGLADKLRSEGKAVLGAGHLLDVLELDRIRALALLEDAGLRVPETVPFEDASFARAIDFVRGSAERWVFKASDNVGTDKTFVADDPEQMAIYLEHLDQTIEHEEAKRPKFLLQAFVDGVEVSTERWYSHGEPVDGLDNSTFEAKKFLAGDLGSAVGCAGNVVLPHRDRRLLAETVDHLDALAAEHGITGPIDLNAIVATADRHAYVLEVTGRFGYYALQALAALLDQDLGELLHAMATGDVAAVTFRDRIGAAIPISMAPYPARIEHERGTPIVDEILDDESIWPVDVMLDDQGRLVVAGVDGVIYVATATGPTIASALHGCYETLQRSRMPDRQYRIDLSYVLSKRLDELRRLGYLAAEEEPRGRRGELRSRLGLSR